MLKTEIKTASDLRDFHEEYNPDSHFFNRSTMQFFGDTMKNYGVCKVVVRNSMGVNVMAWELYRRQPVKHGIKSSTYFNTEDFKIINTFD